MAGTLKPPGCGSSCTHACTHGCEKMSISRAFSQPPAELMSEDAKVALGF